MMQTSLSKRHDILRAFYALIAIVAVSMTVVTTTALVGRTKERSLRQRLEQFHLRTAMLTFEASRQASLLELELAALAQPASGAGDPVERIASGRTIRTSVHAIGQAIDSIVELHREWPRPVDPIAGTLARAAQQYGELLDEMVENRQVNADFLGDVGALKFTLFQLNRLHAIATKELHDQLTITGQRTSRNTNLLTAIVLLIAGLIAARILFLLRLRLREHEQTEHALLDREQQLRQSSKMEALGSLVGGVAHDFNNLLMAILGHTEILLSKKDRPDTDRKSLREIRNAGERAAGLTRQLLIFSRQQLVEPSVVDPNLMIRELEPMLRRLIPASITLEFVLEPDVGNVEIDPIQIEQVLVNLAVNARDAMGDGGVLSIRTSSAQIDATDSSETVPGNYVQIRVEDSGSGMNPETLSRIFDPFFTTKPPGKGTGLGLATVYGIVTKAGGQVTAHSEVGKGTRFEVRLPRCDKQAREQPGDSEQSIVPHGTETVLVAEDEAQIRGLVVSALREAGYRVLEAGDGSEGLRLCSEHRGQIDLILSDVVMPELCGPEMVQRALESQPHARVIYVSGYAEDEVMAYGASADAPLLSKPFKLHELLNLVRQELDIVGSHDELVSGLTEVSAADVDGPVLHRS